MGEADDDDRAFRKSSDDLLPYRTRLAALTAIAANGLFALAVDRFTLPADALFFCTVVRLAFTPAYLALMLLAHHRLGRRAPEAVVLLFGATLAIDLALVGAPLPAADNVGLFPAILFLVVFLPLRRVPTALLAASFAAAFFGIHLWLGHSSLGAVLKHTGNLLATGAISLVAAAMSDRLRRSEFLAVRRLAAANVRLEELGRVKDQFFTDVSHELRTPLTAALLSLEAGDAGVAHPAVRPLRRLQKLVDELLELSRVDAGFAGISGEVIDLVAALRPMVDEFSAAFESRHLRLQFEAPAEPVFVRVGQDALEKIAVNILGNALKYTQDGGRVEVRIARSAGSAALEVRDDGPGIAADQIPRIFDRFVRLDRPRFAPGSGIGLALARELAELHGGRLTCESAPGQGTLFRATWAEAAPATPLPAARQPIHVAGAVAAALDGLPGEAALLPAQPISGDRPLVLVVEDHAQLAERIAAALGAGVRTRLAHDGNQGLALARSLRPDLIISDVLLPGLSGHELARKLREEPAGRLVPILLLSALAGREHTLQGLAAGADDTMAKPFDAALLRARVEALLRLRLRREEGERAAPVLRPLCRALAVALDYDAVLLLSAQPDGSLGVSAWGGAAEPPASGWESADAPWVAAIAAARALVSDGAPSGPLPAAAAGFGRAAAAPVAHGERLALLVGVARARRPVTAAELDSLATAALCAALLLERERSMSALARSADEQRRLSAAVLSGQDSERKRLAFELHDGTGQTLAGALLHLDLARRDGRASGLDTASELVRQAIDELRGLARDLHPPVLAQQGLPLTLRALAASMSSERMAIVSEIQPPAPADLGAATSLALFRISQAALANVANHSGARRATLRLCVEPLTVRLEIEDDGVGFLPSLAPHGVGMLGMRERAASLGGTLSIESAPGRGTLVRATLPLVAPGDFGAG